MRLLLLILAFVAFTVWSLVWIADEGLIGLVDLVRHNDWGAQVFVDLAISLLVACSFMVADARRHGLRFLPWSIAILLFGSIGVLAYLVRRELHLRRRERADAPA